MVEVIVDLEGIDLITVIEVYHFIQRQGEFIETIPVIFFLLWDSLRLPLHHP